MNMQNIILPTLATFIFAVSAGANEFCYNGPNRKATVDKNGTYHVVTGGMHYNITIIPLNKETDLFIQDSISRGKEFCVQGTSAPVKLPSSENYFGGLDGQHLVYAYEAYRTQR